MSWFNFTRRHRAGHEKEKEGLPPPFPTLSTFLGIAAAMIALWLLAYGLPHLLSASDHHPVPSNNSEAGTSK